MFGLGVFGGMQFGQTTVSAHVNVNQPGRSRLKGTTTQDLQGQSRLYILRVKTLTGKTRLSKAAIVFHNHGTIKGRTRLKR